MPDLDTDVVVVGSGSTGGWVCKILTEAGHSVTLLEAGPAIGASECPSTWYDGATHWQRPAQPTRQPVQHKHPAYCDANKHLWIDDIENPYLTDADKAFVWIRARSEGGRSNLWGGQCWRLTEREFAAAKEDGFGECWPLSYGDLLPYYEEVERFQGVRGRRDEAGEMPDQIVTGEVDLTDAEADLIHEAWQRWRRIAIACRTAVGRRSVYRDAGAWPRFSSLGSTLPDALRTGRLRIVNNAVVARLGVDAGGHRVRTAEYVDASTGREQRISAKAFVLCASTLESTRILLNSADARHSRGLGNASGALGRFLMDHNATFVVGATEKTSVSDRAAFFGGRHGVYLPHFETARADRVDFLRGYAVWATLARPVGDGINALLLAVGEMLPYAHNTITLDRTRVDRWGIPVPKIDCVPGENERKMIRHQKRSLLAVAEAANVKLAMPPDGVTPGAMVHEVGTARMGADPATSFCNSYAQSWEVPNLFVPDGACWTTSAYQNPTLTMMAIAVRCARRLSRRLTRAQGARKTSTLS